MIYAKSIHCIHINVVDIYFLISFYISDTWSEHLDSQKLRNVLESFKVVIPSNLKNSIARDLLTGPILIELVKEVRDLARSVVFCKNLKEEKKKPGTVYACEVVVKIVDNQVVIYEKVL